ncbi:hypothetical protein GCM10011609_62720 [Lentzea pudingi]|uniref:ANTAR domain-containing protein n=1 Tax=Lentzea pudingi TaxID=1789439 RepID=A0ABQ2IMH5_9PSEU|nr:hypothetical protein [Lentzea pudingi]GGN13612.1 hypothetical protein GCM10011609_62720 [Lentzea pudingi]
MHGADVELLRPLRRFTLFASAVTLALNVADPLLSGEHGKAAFDAVGPVLLIGWAEVGPGLLQAMSKTGCPQSDEPAAAREEGCERKVVEIDANAADLDRARRADALYWTQHKRPISVDAIRVELKISMDRARELVIALRAELTELVVGRLDDLHPRSFAGAVPA